MCDRDTPAPVKVEPFGPDHHVYSCPKCNRGICTDFDRDYYLKMWNYCPDCGQAWDWSEVRERLNKK